MHTLSNALPRISGAMFLAALATMALLIFMHDLIRLRSDVPDARPVSIITEFVRIPEPPPIIEPPRRVQPPSIPPPPDILIYPEASGLSVGMEMGIPPPAPTQRPSLNTTLIPSGDYLPIFKVQPDYPNTAQRRGIEGFVVLRFTVDELGRVIDPEVLESVPQGVFDRSALEAVQRFKYKPRVLDGTASRVSGVLHRITYSLNES